MNPAVDVSLSVDQLVPVHKLRATSSVREAGGGGVNVARLLTRLGADVEAVVAVGGATGAAVVAALADAGVAVTALSVDGATRESIQIHDEANDLRYRIVVDGPPLTESVDSTVELLREQATPSVNVFSGSLPVSCPATIYADLSLVHPSAFTIVDTSGDALRASLSGSVDLLKPSLRELEGLAGQEIADAGELETVMVELLRRHPSLGSVLTSLGGAGAVLCQREQPLLHFCPPDVPVVSAVGAGDSLVAGVAWGVSRGEDLVNACRFGIAAGTATVATPGTALCSAASALELLADVDATELRPDHPIR